MTVPNVPVVARRPVWLGAPNRILNMSTGPVEVSNAVLRAQEQPLLTPHSDSFWDMHDETIGSLGRILMTDGRVLMFHGSIRAGIDVALGNVLRPGSKVLSVINGFWGTLLADWAEMRGAEVTRVSFGALDQVDLGRVADALTKHDYDLVTVVHVETNSGIVNPISEIGALVAPTRALFLVDSACSAGAMPIDTDEWHIDIQTTGSHKCLAAIPGLAVVTLSDKAWERLGDFDQMGAYFDFRTLWRNTIERQTQPWFTQPTTLIHALSVALAEIEAQGLDTWWAAHRAVGTHVRTALREIGFELLLDRGNVANCDAHYSDTVLALRYPPGIDDARFRRALLHDYGVFVIGNLGEFAGRSFRMGLMSASQMQAINVNGALAAIAEVLASPEVRTGGAP